MEGVAVALLAGWWSCLVLTLNFAAASCRIVAPMSETEKLLNKQLLEKVQKAGLGMTSTQQQQLNQQLGSGCIRTATASKRAQKC